MNRVPVRDCADLATIDEAEILEGYWDGRTNEPCGGNRSRSYWHGWRNGMMDAHHLKGDKASAALARDYCQHKRQERAQGKRH